MGELLWEYSTTVNYPTSYAFYLQYFSAYKKTMFNKLDPIILILNSFMWSSPTKKEIEVGTEKKMPFLRKLAWEFALYRRSLAVRLLVLYLTLTAVIYTVMLKNICILPLGVMPYNTLKKAVCDLSTLLTVKNYT